MISIEINLWGIRCNNFNFTDDVFTTNAVEVDEILLLMFLFCFAFLKVFGGHMSFLGATGTPVLDFW